MLTFNSSIDVAAVMCHLSMDTSLVKVLNTITLATYHEIAKMCIYLIWERISAVEKCAKWVHMEIIFGMITNVIGT